MKNEQIKTYLRYAAVAGNILLVLWVLFNAIDSGFRGTLPEKFSALFLVALLAINSILILSPKEISN